MSFQPHLMDGEDIIDYCMTGYWAWVCAEQRVLKYRKGRGTAEQLHDLSYNEISAISLVNLGRDDKLGGYGVFAVIVAIGLAIAVPDLRLVSLVLFGVAAYLIYRWLNSEEAYFEFRGSGILRSEGDEWRIDQTSAEHPENVRSFVRTVRSRLS